MNPVLGLTVADTLRCDSLSLVEWKSQSDYDYSRELVTPDFNLMQWITEKVQRFLSQFFDVSIDEDYVRLIWIITGVIVLAAIIYLLVRYRPKLFGSTGKNKEYYPEEDTIYGIDFEKAIRHALDNENYHEAVRMVYLQTLRYLSDNDYINWQIFKTPTQYIVEMQNDTFRTFSMNFVRVRYGNYDADVSLCETMQDLQDTLRQQCPPKEGVEKGGEE